MSGNQLILRALEESTCPFSLSLPELSIGSIIKINQLALGVESKELKIDVSLSGSLCQLHQPTLFLPPPNEISYHCA